MYSYSQYFVDPDMSLFSTRLFYSSSPERGFFMNAYCTFPKGYGIPQSNMGSGASPALH